MTIRYVCDQCDTQLESPDKHAGKKSRCPVCNTPLIVPPSDRERRKRAIRESIRDTARVFLFVTFATLVGAIQNSDNSFAERMAWTCIVVCGFLALVWLSGLVGKRKGKAHEDSKTDAPPPPEEDAGA